MTEFNFGAMLSQENQVKQIPLDMLVPYQNHQFTLYDGERRDDMVESIHLLINSLLDKGMIEIVGFIKNAKNYSRTFKAKLSKAEYIIMCLGDECGYKECIETIVNQTDTVSELDEYLRLIAKHREEIAT